MVSNPVALELVLAMPASRWRLDADTDTMRDLAGVWGELSRSADSTQGRIDPAAQNLADRWRGAGRDAYHSHRIELSAGITGIARAAGTVVSALDNAANTVRGA